MAFRTASGQSYTLGSSVSSTSTSILLTSFTVPVTGTTITMATMGTDIAYGTIAPGTSQSELVSFTGVTQNSDGTATLTGVTRGLDKQYPGTSVAGFKQPHAGQSIFILSDAPQIFNTEMAALRNDNTWTGRQQFPTAGTASAAVVGASYVAPTADNEVATKKYVDNTALFGAPNATTTTAGIVQMPTQAQVEAGTQIGSTGAQLDLPNVAYGARKVIGYGITSGSGSAYTLTVTPTPTTYATGQIVGFQASFTNPGNSTININGLGAKNLFLGSTGLFAGAIATGNYVGAVYDGVQFSILEGSSLISAAASANTVGLRRSTGDMTVPTTPTATTDAASKAYVDNATFLTSGAPGTTTTNTTATVLTYALTGGILSTNKGLRIRATIQSAITATNSGATYTIQYGGTTIGSFGYAGNAGTPTVTAISIVDIMLLGSGATNTQKANVLNNTVITSGSGGGATGAIAQSYSATIDSTTSQNITISCTSGANVTGTIIDYFIQKVT